MVSSRDQSPSTTAATPKSAAPDLTCFGAGLDRLVVAVADWPEGAVVHTVMVLNPRIDAPPDRKQIEVKGAIPKGADAKGYPVFGKRAEDFRAVITLAQYRAALADSEASSGQTPGGPK